MSTTMSRDETSTVPAAYRETLVPLPWPVAIRLSVVIWMAVMPILSATQYGIAFYVGIALLGGILSSAYVRNRFAVKFTAEGLLGCDPFGRRRFVAWEEIKGTRKARFGFAPIVHMNGQLLTPLVAWQRADVLELARRHGPFEF